MSQLVHRKFVFPSRCNARDIVLRETNGVDEQRAALQADARGERTSIYQELVRLSIVEVDGEPATQPFLALEQWNSRTRALVQNAYQELNDLQDEEVAAFLSTGKEATVESAPPKESQQPRDEVSPRRSKAIAK